MIQQFKKKLINLQLARLDQQRHSTTATISKEEQQCDRQRNKNLNSNRKYDLENLKQL
jgi:hypothetical protein